MSNWNEVAGRARTSVGLLSFFFLDNIRASIEKISQFLSPARYFGYLTGPNIVQIIMGVKSLLLCDEKVCNRRTKSLQVTKMISVKPTNSRLLLSETTQRPGHQQFIEPNALISLLFIILLRTSSVLSMQVSDGGNITTGDDQTPRVQSSSGSRPRILSRSKEDDVSLLDEITHSQESTSPDKRDDLMSRRRSPSRLLMTANTTRGYKFTASSSSAAASSTGPDELNALLAIKKSFVDNLGVLDSWRRNSGNRNKNSNFSHCRTWVGVTCNTLQQVVEIDLSYFYTLGGTISPVFGRLKQLVVLDLSYNSLEGGIPSELGELSRLRVLRLSYNGGLSGKKCPSFSDCRLSVESLFVCRSLLCPALSLFQLDHPGDDLQWPLFCRALCTPSL